jgi:threonine dehydratase
MVSEFIQAYSRLKGVANITPVLSSRTLNTKIGNGEVYFKCENFQRVGAFKFRGAYNTIVQLSDDEKHRGIITHSSGNHAQAVALVGKLLNIKTLIIMPENAPQVKVTATKGYGAEVVFSKSSIQAREEMCNKLIEEGGYTLIHPYDNQNIIYGAGTAALELVNEVGELDYLLTPVGGGGLISGSSRYVKESGTASFVLGAEPEMADDAYRSLKTKKLVTFHQPKTIADGLRTLLSPLTFSHIQKYVDDIILVSELEIIQAMKLLWERMKIVVEPSGVVPLAATIKGYETGIIPPKSKIGIILSGGNIDLTTFFQSITENVPH